MVKHILVPLDGSELAESVLSVVEPMAKQLGARVTLLRVVDINAITRSVLPATPDAAGFTPEMQSIIDDSIAAEVREATEYLDAVAKRIGGDVVTRVEEGVPAEVLLDAIEEEGVDMAAIATHGRSGITRTLFGSVADHLVRRSGKPILVVRPKAE